MKLLKIILLICIIVASFPAIVPASSTVGINSSTYISTYGLNVNNTNNKYLPFYEDLNFKYPAWGNNLSIEASGWVRYDLLNSLYSHRTNTDLAYGYVNYKSHLLPLRVRLGRIYSWFGTANDRYDGLELLISNLYGMGIGAFIGREVNPELHNTPEGITTGGRLSYDTSIFGIGGSVFYADTGSYTLQERWGIDGWLKPVDILYIYGRYYYDPIDKRLYDGTVRLSLTPEDKLFLNVQYALFNPASLISKTSIFWVFNTESYRTINGDIGYRILNNLSIALDATGYMYSSFGNSYSYGGRITYDKSPYSAGLELSKIDATPTDYLKTRLYAFRNFALGFYANADVIWTSYFGKLNGYDHGITGHIGVGKTIMNNLKLTISGNSMDGPYVRHGGYAMLSLKYIL